MDFHLVNEIALPAPTDEMDCPEWVAIHPETKDVYCSLTNNCSRGKGKPSGKSEPLGADADPARNDPKNPKAFSSWPDGDKGGRPRSATIATRRLDGGIVGT